MATSPFTLWNDTLGLSKAFADDMGQKLSEWPAIKRRFESLQPIVVRTVETMRKVQGSDVLDTNSPGLDIYSRALAWYNERDTIAEQAREWDAEFLRAVREAHRRGHITAEEAGSIGYGGVGALPAAFLIFAVVVGVAIIAWGNQWITRQYDAQVRIKALVLAHERQAVAIKTAGEAWARAYASDHSLPFPSVPADPNTNAAAGQPSTADKALDAVKTLGVLGVLGVGLYAASRVFGGSKS